MIDYKKYLNQEQVDVIEHGDGPCLVLAGAGSGKTRTLVYRVAYLIERGVKPENILLVTFTNKAAREMVTRVEELLGYKPENFWGGTFHRVGNMILRRHAHLLGYGANFNILDQDDSIGLVKKVMQENGIDASRTSGFPKPSVVHSIISYSRNSNEDVRRIAEDDYGYADFVSIQIRRIADGYRDKKKSSNAMDFDDLLVNWLRLLEHFPYTRDEYAKRFRYILVDEYQDTNFIQAEVVRQLARFHNNVLVVGDDSQSIYSFRAAQVKNILDFPKLFPGAKVFKIETNYRSTPQILGLANDAIKHNRGQFEKKLKAVREDNTLPSLIPCRDERHQAAQVVKRIMQRFASGVDYQSMAVLYRATYESAELELELSKRGIPYIVRGGLRYFEQAHIKDVVAYLKVLSNFHDEISWRRVLQLYDGIGEKTADSILRIIKKAETLRDLLTGDSGLSGRASEHWAKVLQDFQALDRLDKTKKGFVSASVEQVLSSGYEAHLKNSYENYRERLDDLYQFVNFVAAYADLERLLADIMLSESFSKDNSQNNKSVVLSTIHQAKGLEWPLVFIIGLRDGRFPHHKSMEDQKELEEERRLFYVAVTRAKDELNLLYPIRVFNYGGGEDLARPSMFIRELDNSKYSVSSAPELWQDLEDVIEVD
ncbi:MAG: ATP-dependent helicase [Parcubacteria group bacterium]